MQQHPFQQKLREDSKIRILVCMLRTKRIQTFILLGKLEMLLPSRIKAEPSRTGNCPAYNQLSLLMKDFLSNQPKSTMIPWLNKDMSIVT